MLKLVERDDLTIHGWITTLHSMDSPDELIEMSKQKMRAKEEYASNIEGDLYAVNAVINGDQCYLIGNSDTEQTRPSEFKLPAGTYAGFDLTYTDQGELDRLIGQSYAEVMQSDAYQVAGNFNLEEYSAVGKVSFYVPVQKKEE